MAAALQRAWLQRGIAAHLLRPLAILFGTVAAMRRAAYRVGILKAERLSVPVIVVGNVVVGGTGKTPVVMALVEHLKKRGLVPGVISRGYRRIENGCQEVRLGMSVNQVGDEPMLIAKTCKVPVFVAPSRVQAGRALLAAYPDIHVIVCDDGLQHYGLQRDIEICVFDERGIGNGWLLPAGPLREPWPRPVDLILCAGANKGIQGFEVERHLGRAACRQDGTQIELSALRNRPLKAIAAIAKPEAFFEMLRRHGLQLARTVALPDHDDFGSQAINDDDSELICTEKDAVKLWRLHPNAWAASLVLSIQPGFWNALDHLIDAKLSLPHGPETS